MRTELNVQHQLGGRLCASNHARNPRARMRPRADEVKIRNHIVAVVGAEPGALPEDRLETERAAEVCGQVAAEIGGRVVETRDEIGAEAGRHAAFDLIQYGVGESDRKSTRLNSSH